MWHTHCSDNDRLDVSQHMSLCRHYVRELRRSMLIDTPDMDKATSKRSSQLLDLDNLDGADAVSSHLSSHPSEKRSQEQKVSAILRAEDPNQSLPRSRENAANATSPNLGDYSPAHSMTSARSNRSGAPLTNTGIRQSADRERPSTRGQDLLERPPRPSFMTSSHLDSDSPGHTVARNDLKASAEKILYTFIIPDSEREIVLPQQMVERMIHAIEDEGRDDPEIFDDAKDYVFQAMERDAFPGFLQAKALGNLVPLSILVRLIIGLLSLGGGFWAGYYCILRMISRSTRCWVSFQLSISDIPS